MKVPRKASAFVLTDALLILGAIVVQNQNYGALATGLIGAMVAFVTGHSIAETMAMRTGKKEEGEGC